MNGFTKDITDLFLSSIQLIIVLISAIWAYFRFRKEDPLRPRIEFDINCKFFGPQQNSFLTSFIVSANNKGNVEHRFSEILVKVRGTEVDEVLSEFKGHEPMVNFPLVIMKQVNIVPKQKLEYFFVRPGVNQNFHYYTKISKNTSLILVKAIFKYQESDEKHYAEKIFEVKRT